MKTVIGLQRGLTVSNVTRPEDTARITARINSLRESTTAKLADYLESHPQRVKEMNSTLTPASAMGPLTQQDIASLRGMSEALKLGRLSASAALDPAKVSTVTPSDQHPASPTPIFGSIPPAPQNQSSGLG